MDSILTSIKKLSNISERDANFDVDIIIYINGIFSTLSQVGIGPEDGFSISDDTAVWKDFIGESKTLEFVKTYIALKVRVVFDPPTNSAILNAYKEEIKELEWRLGVQADEEEA